MLLIGNNSLDLSPASVMAIVEKHLNDSMDYGLRRTQEIKVQSVKASEGSYVFGLTVTDKPPEQKAGA